MKVKLRPEVQAFAEIVSDMINDLPETAMENYAYLAPEQIAVMMHEEATSICEMIMTEKPKDSDDEKISLKIISVAMFAMMLKRYFHD